MKREHFVKVVEEALDSLPQEFRSRIKNVAILVEDFPANQSPPLLRWNSPRFRIGSSCSGTVGAIVMPFDAPTGEHRFRIGIQQQKQHCLD